MGGGMGGWEGAREGGGMGGWEGGCKGGWVQGRVGEGGRGGRGGRGECRNGEGDARARARQEGSTRLSLNTMDDAGLRGSILVRIVSVPGSRTTGRCRGRPPSSTASSHLLCVRVWWGGGVGGGSWECEHARACVWRGRGGGGVCMHGCARARGGPASPPPPSRARCCSSSQRKKEAASARTWRSGGAPASPPPPPAQTAAAAPGRLTAAPPPCKVAEGGWVNWLFVLCC